MAEKNKKDEKFEIAASAVAAKEKAAKKEGVFNAAILELGRKEFEESLKGKQFPTVAEKSGPRE